MARLIYNAGLFDERVYDLENGITLGRAKECDGYLLNKNLSRQHASIQWSDGRAFVVDLQSKNGTFVNGARVDRQELKDGDKIALGGAIFTFVEGDVDVTSAVSSVPGSRDQRGGLGDDFGVMPTLVVSPSRVSIEDLLAEPGGASALKVKPTDAAQRAQDKLQILLKVSQMLSSPGEIDALLRRILELVFQVLDVDRGAVLLVDERTGALEPRVMRQAGGDGDVTPFHSRQIVDYVRSRSVAAIFSDAAFDPRLAGSESVVAQSIRASMCAPLRPKEEVIGVLYVDNLTVSNRFSREDLDFLAAFANHAATAIENVLLYRRIEEDAVDRMQTVMRQKLSSLSAVVAGIAHEIKNPLNFINNFADLSVDLANEMVEHLAALGPDAEPGALRALEETLAGIRQNAGKISEHGRRANSIINGMLLHARGSHGVRERVDLNALVAESAHLGYRGVQAKDPSFTALIEEDYDESIGLVELVRGDMSRVFINVVDNACYAMRQKRQALGAGYAPALVVTTRERRERVEVRVRDNGTGIAPEIVDRIFDPFFSTKPPGEGAGLGLSLSYEITVQGHQGEMRMETVLGESTELVIILPKEAVTSSRRS